MSYSVDQRDHQGAGAPAQRSPCSSGAPARCKLTDAGRGVRPAWLSHVLDDLDDCGPGGAADHRPGPALLCTLGYVIGAGLELVAPAGPHLTWSVGGRDQSSAAACGVRLRRPHRRVCATTTVDAAIVRPPSRPGRRGHPGADHRAPGGLPAGQPSAGQAGESVSCRRTAAGADHRRARLRPGRGAATGCSSEYRTGPAPDRGRGPHPGRRVGYGGPRRRHQHHVGRARAGTTPGPVSFLTSFPTSGTVPR